MGWLRHLNVSNKRFGPLEMQPGKWHHILPFMACVAAELLTLLIAERRALERLKRLRGYPDKSVIDAAEKL